MDSRNAPNPPIRFIHLPIAIGTHVPISLCEECGYDLYNSLREDATECPQCGTSIVAQIRRNRARGYYLEAGQLGGRRMVPVSAWTPGMTEFMARHDIRELHLNVVRGWVAGDLGFLRDLMHLEGLIFNEWKPLDLDQTPINSLHALRYLSPPDFDRRKSVIDFSNFPYLKDCNVEWRKGLESVLQCRSLERLRLAYYKARDCQGLAALRNLRELRIVSSPLRSVVGVAALPRLKFLGLGYMRVLTSLEDAGRSASLEHLDTESCRKITDLTPLEGAPRLKEMALDVGELSNLRSLLTLPALEVLRVNVKISDGDIGILLKMPSLARANIRPFRHYTHTHKQINAVLKQRHPEAWSEEDEATWKIVGML